MITLDPEVPRVRVPLLVLLVVRERVETLRMVVAVGAGCG